MTRTGFYPGSFDPVTYGHLDIIARAARIVDKLVLGVGAHHGKQALLSAEQRFKLLETGHPRRFPNTPASRSASSLSTISPSMRRGAPMPASSSGACAMRATSTTRSRWAR